MADMPSIRRRMADRIARRGIRDSRVLDALRTIPREAFVSPGDQSLAYEDRPLPIGEQQTISQPFIVALMMEAAEIGPEDRVLEIGAGSGYAAALLGHLAASVHAVERHDKLARDAAGRIASLSIGNVTIHKGDGTKGWPASAPYDAILVAAAAQDVPQPLFEQLATGGHLIIPIGLENGTQRLMKYIRSPVGSIRSRDLGEVRFVPLVPGEPRTLNV
jgi:protein-L-isoaspartate(D-aspartate) O-methyltransferase